MADNYVLLTDEEASLLRGLLRDMRNQRHNPAQRPYVPESEPTTPEVYLAFTPTAGIPAMGEASGTGSPDYYTPGMAVCPIYRFIPNGTGEQIFPTGQKQPVYNTTASAVAGDSLIIIGRDKWGIFYPITLGSPSGGNILVFSPEGGIPGLTEPAGTGSPDFYVPGAATCGVYRMTPGTPPEYAPTGKTVTVYNLSLGKLPAHTLLVAVQNTDGLYFAVGSGATGTATGVSTTLIPDSGGGTAIYGSGMVSLDNGELVRAENPFPNCWSVGTPFRLIQDSSGVWWLLNPLFGINVTAVGSTDYIGANVPYCIYMGLDAGSGLYNSYVGLPPGSNEVLTVSNFPATPTQTGVITTGEQEIGGDKTWDGLQTYIYGASSDTVVGTQGSNFLFCSYQHNSSDGQGFVTTNSFLWTNTNIGGIYNAPGEGPENVGSGMRIGVGLYYYEETAGTGTSQFDNTRFGTTISILPRGPFDNGSANLGMVVFTSSSSGDPNASGYRNTALCIVDQTGEMHVGATGTGNSGDDFLGGLYMGSGSTTPVILTIGSTTISGGTAFGILYDNGGTVGSVAPTGVAQILVSGSLSWVTPSGDMTMNSSGVFTIGAGAVTNAKLAGGITFSNLVGTDITGVGTITSGVWHGTALTASYLPTLDAISAPVAAVSLNSEKITNLATCTASTDAANKGYVDSVAQGLSVKNSCQCATTTTLPTNSYSNGTAGVGATLTATTSGVLTIDGYAVALNDRVLVKGESSGAHNGIYTVTTLGTSGVPYVLTRAIDSDTPADLQTAFTFIENGTVNAATGWVNTNTGTITIGTTALAYVQFSGAGAYTNGAGLTLTGNVFSIGAGQVTNAMLAGSIAASKLVGTDITTVGTITTGTWNGTAIANAYLANSSATLNGHVLSLGGTLSLTATDIGLSNVTNDAQTKAAVVPNTAPAAGKILVGNAGGTAYAPETMSGDATLASTGALTLAASGATAGTYGDGSHYPVITVDSKGRVTAAAQDALATSAWPPGYINGFNLSYNSTTVVNVAAGSAVDSTGTVNMTLAAGTINLAGSAGLGAWDYATQTGSIAVSGTAVTGTSTTFLTAFGTRVLSGTVSTSGTAATGTSTSFLSQIAVGDLIGNATLGYFRVTAIADDTHCTLSGSLSASGATLNCIESPYMSGSAANTVARVVAIADNTHLTTATSVITTSSSWATGNAHPANYAGDGTNNSWLSVFLVVQSGTTGVIFSSQRTTPYLASVTSYRFIGWVLLNSSGNIIVFRETGEGNRRTIHWEDGTGNDNLQPVSSVGNTARFATVATSVPAGMAPCVDTLNLQIYIAGPTNQCDIEVRQANSGSSRAGAPLAASCVAGGQGVTFVDCPVDGAQQFLWGNNTSPGNNVNNIQIVKAYFSL